MTQALIARSGVAPVFREPSPRVEQVTQLVLGETARILETQASWRRIKCDDDGYEGWVHTGYVLEVDAEAARSWRNEATAWSEGAVVRAGDAVVRLPVRARVRLAEGRVGLPGGIRGSLIAGSVARFDDVRRRARLQPAWLWALKNFAGTPYLWGGVTPWGVDCSALVQTTFRARGASLPRDSADQAGSGAAVPPDDRRPGDLLFFTEGGDRITHVAILGADDALVHATLSCGGFVVEPWKAGTRAAFLRDRLAAVRRVE